jgi:hypothetical protein
MTQPISDAIGEFGVDPAREAQLLVLQADDYLAIQGLREIAQPVQAGPSHKVGQTALKVLEWVGQASVHSNMARLYPGGWHANITPWGPV